MEEIETLLFQEKDLKGATVLSGFPSAGLVSTIAANYLIGSLNLDQIGALDCEAFPPVSMIYDSTPKFPARIYASEELKLVVFLSEFTPVPPLARPIGRVLVEFYKNHGCDWIIAPEVISRPREGETLEVFGVGCNDRARKELKRFGIRPLQIGMVTGITGVLLNEGRRHHLNVIALIAEAQLGIPDARAAAKVLEILDRFVPTLEINVEPLYEEAERIEAKIREMRKQAKQGMEPAPSAVEMYR
jgi:uncharacterized protein